MDPKVLNIGDKVIASSVGEGYVTGFHKGQYPEVNGKPVGNLTRSDGAKFGGAAGTLELAPVAPPQHVEPVRSLYGAGPTAAIEPAAVPSPPPAPVTPPVAPAIEPAKAQVTSEPPTVHVEPLPDVVKTPQPEPPPATDEFVAPGHSLFSDPSKLKEGSIEAPHVVEIPTPEAPPVAHDHGPETSPPDPSQAVVGEPLHHSDGSERKEGE